MIHEAIRALATRLRTSARAEYQFCSTDDAREMFVGARLDLAEELDSIAYVLEVEAHHRNEMMFA